MASHTCARCGAPFSIAANSLRKFCFTCSPFRTRDRAYLVPHNSGKTAGKRRIDAQGYVRVYFPKKDRAPGTERRSHYLEHILVMQRKLNRFLLSGENVHHINGDKADNRPENLELWITHQPKGQRSEDLVKWAQEILARYA